MIFHIQFIKSRMYDSIFAIGIGEIFFCFMCVYVLMCNREFSAMIFFCVSMENFQNFHIDAPSLWNRQTMTSLKATIFVVMHDINE